MKRLLIIALAMIFAISCDRSSENEHITTIVNTADFEADHPEFEFSATVSTCWTKKDEAVSSIIVRDPNTKLFTSSIIRRTFDGGKSWELCNKFKYIVRDIQYVDGILYAYQNDSSNEFELGVNDPSWLITSSDLGKTWNVLYRFDYNISNLMIIDSTTMIAVSKINTKPMVDNRYSSEYFVISRDGGKNWNRIDGLPRIDTSPMPIYKVGSKLYFRVDVSGVPSRLHSFDLNTGKCNPQKVSGDPMYLYTYAVVDDLLMQPLNGMFNSGIHTLKMVSDSLEYISDYAWGWRAGSYSVDYAAKDGNYVFLYSSRFPGNHDVNRALHFSSDYGNKWDAIAFSPKEVALPYAMPLVMSWASYTDDSTFQISAIGGDVTRIYRVNK